MLIMIPVIHITSALLETGKVVKYESSSNLSIKTYKIHISKYFSYYLL